MAFAIDLGIVKTNKYASRESGDTAEFVERPAGGFSVVMADGQGSGRAAKSLSLMVTSKAVALLKEGVRDGAVARGVHDFLFAYRHGQVSATLDILSVDLRSETVVITRNAETPMLIGNDGEFTAVPGGSGPIGLYHMTRPSVTQVPLAAGLTIILTTDGIPGSGRRAGLSGLNLPEFAAGLGDDQPAPALADRLLTAAIERDQRRPADDMTVVALTLRRHAEPTLIRRLSARIPLP